MRLALLASARVRFQYVFLAILIEILADSGLTQPLVRQIYSRVVARIDNTDETEWVFVPKKTTVNDPPPGGIHIGKGV